jgi:Uncharacterized protein conserved in bacteria
MLNPSTADHTEDDPTIGRCISFAQNWGFGSLHVGNLFAFKTPYPVELFRQPSPIGDENDRWLADLSNTADLTVAAWGNNGKFMGRGKAVLPQLKNPHFLKMTKQDEPSHPLYLSRDLKPTAYSIRA